MRNKLLLLVIFITFSTTSCRYNIKTNTYPQDIIDTEKAFEKMCAEKGIAEAFEYYADENAVILRENDTLIKGKTAIKEYYLSQNSDNTTVTWTPDLVDVSEDGSMAYTYGKYSWQHINDKGDTTRTSGIFHTVWKKQADGGWKYVWD